jgi:methionyl-tRNA formyltransferase
MKRILFFGMRGLFSKIPFESLIQAGADICAVIVPAESPGLKSWPRRVDPPPPAPSDLPLFTPYLQESIVHLAWQHHIPVWEVRKLGHKKTLTILAGLQPDLICVVCFPYIFPPTLLQLPRDGCVNLHPSLLPAYRGPTPLFWVMRQGETQTGVTLHFLDEGVDSGDIISQVAFALPEGISELELTRRCALEGAALLVEAVQQLESGPLPRRPQSDQRSSYFPAPSAADLRIPPTWPARRAFNFLRGANTWPLTLDLSESEVIVAEALSYDDRQRLSDPFIVHADEVWVQFTPGVLKVRGRTQPR